MADTTKIILDTDIGSDIDDAVALAYLLSEPKCELVGITTVCRPTVARAEMASAMCRHVGRDDIPIHPGCSNGLLEDMIQQDAAQADALGDWPRRKDFQRESAVEFLRTTLRRHPGEITLLAIGPLTNLAALLAVDEEAASLLDRLVIMGGRFFSAGCTEWNIRNDPEAAAMVLDSPHRPSAPRTTLLGLDVTTQCTMPADACRKRFTAPVLQPVRDFAEVWFRGFDCVTFHDPLAAACIFQPELCTYRRGRVRVSLHEPTRAMTLLEEADDASFEAAVDVDPQAFLDHYFSVVDAGRG